MILEGCECVGCEARRLYARKPESQEQRFTKLEARAHASATALTNAEDRIAALEDLVRRVENQREFLNALEARVAELEQVPDTDVLMLHEDYEDRKLEANLTNARTVLKQIAYPTNWPRYPGDSRFSYEAVCLWMQATAADALTSKTRP